MFFVTNNLTSRREYLLCSLDSSPRKYCKNDYIKIAINEYNNLYNIAFDESRPTHKSSYPKDKLYPVIDNTNIFGARTTKINNKINLNISLGTFFALDDLFNRLASWLNSNKGT